jgi:GNAT superfamily N-acetyltransferase
MADAAASLATIGCVTDELDWRIRAADRNFIVSFAKLVGQPGTEMRRIGGAVVFDTRIPRGGFNGVAVLEPVETDDLRAAVGWIRGREIPFAVWVREDLVRPVRETLRDARLQELEGEAEPVMGMRPRDELPELPAGVSVREVLDSPMLEDHIRVATANGFPEDAARRLYSEAFVNDPDVRLFTAYADGQPAGHSAAIRSSDVSGVYAVGVPQPLRRRGIGSAVTWAAVQAGREWGCELVVLQSSPMGFGVYRRMGFEVLTRYATYA